MRLTALEEYGLRCLLQLARSASSPAPVTVREIADEEGLSAAYTEKLLRILSRAGLAVSIRGSRGGYRISRPPERVMLGEAVRALGGILSPPDYCHRFSGDRDACAHVEDCGIRPVWGQVQLRLEELLDRVPLSTLLEPEETISRQIETGEWTKGDVSGAPNGA